MSLKYWVAQCSSTLQIIFMVSYLLPSSGKAVAVTERQQLVSQTLSSNSSNFPVKPTPSRLLAVTIGSARTETTSSTVRPWPSHSFFRSVLSKSDNTVGGSSASASKRRKVSRPEKGAAEGVGSLHKSLSHIHSDTSPNSFIKDGANKRRSKDVMKISNETEHIMQGSMAPSNALFLEGSATHLSRSKSDKTHSEVVVPKESSFNSKINLNDANKGKSNSGETSGTALMFPEEGNGNRKRDDNSILHSNQTPLADEFSHINSPGIGFQYEIVMPLPPTFKPFSSSPSLSSFMNTSLHYKSPVKVESTSVPATLETYFKSSGSHNKNDMSIVSSTYSTVTTTDFANDATVADTKETTPYSLSSVDAASEMEKVESAPSRAGFQTSYHLPSYRKSNKSNEQFYSFPQPPTQPSQLKLHGFVESGMKSNVGSQPSSWKIYQSFGSAVEKVSTSTMSSLIRTKKRDREGNSFSVNNSPKIKTGKDAIFSVSHLQNSEPASTILHRKNMFTVTNKAKSEPSIFADGWNGTIMNKNSMAEEFPLQASLFHRTNQMERPMTGTGAILGGPEKVESANVNVFFDEDDSQANLHHWIESEQGHFVSGSTELPRFTNLTWPYYITNGSHSPSANSTFQGSSTDGSISSESSGKPASTLPSTAIAVSFSSQLGKDKVPESASNSQYEFYIPSAAADPKRNLILVGKKRPTNHNSGVPVGTSPPHIPSTPESLRTGIKDIVKHSHWGSNGVSFKPATTPVIPISPTVLPSAPHANKRKPSASEEKSSTGSPKSTLSTFLPNFSISPSTTFTTVSCDGEKLKTHISTSLTPSNQMETASFSAAKTPTNIWYKPTINHFTASMPINGTPTYYESLSQNKEKIPIFPVTTPMPFDTTTPIIAESVGVDNSSGNDISSSSEAESTSNSKNATILFKVWNFIDGKLTLQTQKKIPDWALQDYPIPVNDTILNLQQLPSALQPLVTSALNVEAEASRKSYIWQQLPTMSSPGPTSKSPIPFQPPQKDSNQQEIGFTSNPEWISYTSGYAKKPISINYVLWKYPDSIHQSLTLSTPPPKPSQQFILSPQPTPVSYFPSSIITSQEQQYSTAPYPSSMEAETTTTVVKVKHPGSSTPTTKITSNDTAIKPTTNMSTKDLELFFQNYFQDFATNTSASAPDAILQMTTDAPKAPLQMPPKNIESYNDSTNPNAWSDLKELISRLAANPNNKSGTSNKASITQDTSGEYLENLGNAAAISLLISYLQNEQKLRASNASSASLPKENILTAVQLPETTPPPFGVTDDMTPPHKDQLWATTYPLFQHYLNNPSFTFIPPPPKRSSNQKGSSEITLSPTHSSPIPFTEPPAEDDYAEAASKDYYTKYNHYVSYYPTKRPTRSPYHSSASHIYITESPKRGATTEKSFRSEHKIGELDDDDEEDTDPGKTLLLLKKVKKKKKKLKRKKKKKVAAALVGATLLKKIAGPLMHVVKQPTKYWLDLKFDVDFYDIIKKKFLYFLAYRYMPVFMILALGLIPLALSFVPLFYKIWWNKFKKPKFKFIKIPIPIPKPYPVPVYKPAPHHAHQHHLEHHPLLPPPLIPQLPHSPYYHHSPNFDHNHFNGYHPPQADEQFHNGESGLEYDNEQYYGEHDGVLHIDSPPQPSQSSPTIVDHHYGNEAVSTGMEEYAAMGDYGNAGHSYEGSLKKDIYREQESSFNYNGNYNPSHSTADSNPYNAPIYTYPNPNAYGNGNTRGGQDQEIHVHIHDEEEGNNPQYQLPPVTNPPSVQYTSYNKKDLQPYPMAQNNGMSFDFGQMLSGIPNRQDMEIMKILMETKKENLNKLLEMWKLAKYGVGVASSAAAHMVGGLAGAAASAAGVTTTPSYYGGFSQGSVAGKKRRGKRRKRRKRKKRKPGNVNRKNDTLYLTGEEMPTSTLVMDK